MPRPTFADPELDWPHATYASVDSVAAFVKDVNDQNHSDPRCQRAQDERRGGVVKVDQQFVQRHKRSRLSLGTGGGLSVRTPDFYIILMTDFKYVTS
jgi:hypothetical protein